MTVSPNMNVLQIQRDAIMRVYAMTQADGTDPVGFGKHAGCNYAEIQEHHDSYGQWVRQTAKAEWLEKESQSTKKKSSDSYQKEKMTTTATKAATRTGTKTRPNSPKTDTSSASSSTEEMMRSMMVVVQGLNDEMAEIRADRETRPRKGVSPSSRTDNSYQMVEQDRT